MAEGNSTIQEARRAIEDLLGSKDSDESDDDFGDDDEKRKIQNLLADTIRYHSPLKDIEIVIKYGGDIHHSVRKGLHPLHYAAYHGYMECVQLLLDLGADVNVTDDIGYTPLHLCARRGNCQAMKVLIDNGAIINFCQVGSDADENRRSLGFLSMEPLNLAIQNNQTKCVKLLLERGARPNNKYFMGYEISLVPLENHECLKLLLEHGANPNVFNRCGVSPLMKACREHEIQAVRTLMEHDADIDAQPPPLFEQKTALQFAIQSGNIVISNLLLEMKAQTKRFPNSKYSALHTAVLKGRADICALILKYNADVNERSEELATPLMLACATPELNERQDIVELLLTSGAEVNVYGQSYNYLDPSLSPIVEYLKNVGNAEGFSILIILIRYGAIVHFCGNIRETYRRPDPFGVLNFVHCMRNCVEMFELLVISASKYDVLAIHQNDELPDFLKDLLLQFATSPRELKHLVRLSLCNHLKANFPSKAKLLGLPTILHSYLMYRL